MLIHQLQYVLACRSCKAISPKFIAFLESENEDITFTREELIARKENFEQTQCPNCGTFGNWLCLNIYLNDKNEVLHQVMISVFMENGKLSGSLPFSMFSDEQIAKAIDPIYTKIEKEVSITKPFPANGSAFIVIDLLKSHPYSRIAIWEIKNMNLFSIRQFLDAAINQHFR